MRTVAVYPVLEGHVSAATDPDTADGASSARQAGSRRGSPVARVERGRLRHAQRRRRPEEGIDRG